MKKIDIHVHTTDGKGLPRPWGGTFATPEELIEMYDKLGVEKGVLLPCVTPEGQCDMNTSREIYGIVQKYPDRFAWFCNIDPRQGNNTSQFDFSYMLEYYKALGAKGVGEVTINKPMDDPYVWNFFQCCEKYDMPVTIHIGRLGIDYGLVDELGLPRLERTLQRFPNLKILGHSQPFWSEISGGITEEDRHCAQRGKVKEGGRVVELMRKYPNLCADLSAGSGVMAMRRDPEFTYAFLEEFKDRVYYGTDICSPEDWGTVRVSMGEFLDEAFAQGKISQETYENVCYKNAERLLNK